MSEIEANKVDKSEWKTLVSKRTRKRVHKLKGVWKEYHTTVQKILALKEKRFQKLEEEFKALENKKENESKHESVKIEPLDEREDAGGDRAQQVLESTDTFVGLNSGTILQPEKEKHV